MSEPYVGAKVEVALTKESVRGTGVNPANGDWIYQESIGILPRNEKINYEPGMGRIEQTFRSHTHKEYANGDIRTAVTKKLLGPVLSLLFGQVPSTTGPSGEIYTHNYALLNSNQHASYSVTIKDPIRGYKRFPFALLNALSLEFNVDSITSMTLNLEAGKEEASGATGTSYDTTDEYAFFMPQHVSFKIADDVDGLGAAENQDAMNLTFEFNKNAVKRFKLGSTSPADVINQRIIITGNLEAVYVSDDLRSWAQNEVSKALQLVVDDGESSLTITFPRVTFKDWGKGEDNNAYMNNNVGFQAELDLENGMFYATLANKHANGY